MGVVTGSFRIVAVANGISVYRSPVTVNGPLLQFIDDKSGAVSPDWSKMDAANQPILYPHILHGSNVVAPSAIKWFYNGKELAFDANGNCTTDVWKNLFKLVTQTLQDTKTTPALRIIGNLASGNNMDDDLITCTGTVEVNGSQIDFGEVRFPVTIQNGSTAIPKVFILADSLEVGGSPNPNAVLTAEVYVNAQKQTSTNYTFKFQKQDNKAEGGWKDIDSDGNKCTIKPEMVDGYVSIKATATDSQGTIAGSDIVKVVDVSDPYQLQVLGEDRLKDGATTTLTAKLVKVSDGTEVTGKGLQVEWKFYDNQGKAITDTTAMPVVTNSTAVVTYDKVVAAGGSIDCYLEGTFTD